MQEIHQLSVNNSAPVDGKDTNARLNKQADRKKQLQPLIDKLFEDCFPNTPDGVNPRVEKCADTARKMSFYGWYLKKKTQKKGVAFGVI